MGLLHAEVKNVITMCLRFCLVRETASHHPVGADEGKSSLQAVMPYISKKNFVDPCWKQPVMTLVFCLPSTEYRSEQRN